MAIDGAGRELPQVLLVDLTGLGERDGVRAFDPDRLAGLFRAPEGTGFALTGTGGLVSKSGLLDALRERGFAVHELSPDRLTGLAGDRPGA